MKKTFLISICILLSINLLGCISSPKPTEKSGAVFTAAAETVAVQLTLSALTTKPTQVITPSPIATSTITLPSLPTPSLSPVVPTGKPSPTNPPVTSNCDLADFVADISIPDGTTLNPGTDFTKTWKLLNAGTCAWKTTYSLVFAGGDRLGGPESVKIPQEVAPGSIIELSITLKSPDKAGNYTSYFKIANQNGEKFGIKPNNAAFWVKIVVGAVTPTLSSTPAASPTSSTPSTPTPTTATPIRTNTPITPTVPTKAP